MFIIIVYSLIYVHKHILYLTAGVSKCACVVKSQNPLGSLVATASEKGTIIRVHETCADGRPQELRRGLDRAEAGTRNRHSI